MARHTLLIALLAALVLLVAAHASREEEEEDCRKQLQNVNLKYCEKHLMKRIEREEDDDDDDEDVLTMRGINYIRRRESKEGYKQKCCAQLSEVNILDCRCQALLKIKESLSDKLQGKEMEDLERELRTLPLRCGLAPPLGCDLSSKKKS